MSSLSAPLAACPAAWTTSPRCTHRCMSVRQAWTAASPGKELHALQGAFLGEALIHQHAQHMVIVSVSTTTQQA